MQHTDFESCITLLCWKIIDVVPDAAFHKLRLSINGIVEYFEASFLLQPKSMCVETQVSFMSGYACLFDYFVRV